MEKVDLTKQFACRLHDAMIAAGFNSQRSTSGVSIHKLVEMTGYSAQICRKYLRGEAIPEPYKLMEIAQKLNVAPGWLLFGDAHSDPNNPSDRLTLRRSVLSYLFTRAAHLYNSGLKEDEIANFLMDVVDDVSQINTNEKHSQRIIDLAMSSARHFSPPHGM